MKRLIVGLLVAVLSVASAQGQIKEKPYKWTPIPEVTVQGGKAYMDVNSFRTDKADDGRPFNSVTLLTVYDEPLTVHLKTGETKSGSSVVSNIVIDCATGVGTPIYDFLLVEKTPTKKSIPVASKKYVITPEVMFHLSKGSPMRDALCPEEI